MGTDYCSSEKLGRRPHSPFLFQWETDWAMANMGMKERLYIKVGRELHKFPPCSPMQVLIEPTVI